MRTYATEGSVCWSCGHQHRTIRGAQRCLDRHGRGCSSQGGYSDRYVVAYEGGERVDMTADERDILDALAECR